MIEAACEPWERGPLARIPGEPRLAAWMRASSPRSRRRPTPCPNYLYWGTVRQPDFARAMVNLAGQHRDDMILTIQSYSNDPTTIEGEVDEALSASGVDNFDFLLLGNRNEVPSDGYVEVLVVA